MIHNVEKTTDPVFVDSKKLLLDELKALLREANLVKIIYSINKFVGVTTENERVEIALKCVEKELIGDVVEQIKNFDIAEEGLRARIALECAKRNVILVAKKIKNFEVTNEGLRAQIVSQCIGKKTKETLRNLKCFEITNEDFRIQIALECAKKGIGELAENIEIFEITNEEFRVLIALECAKHHLLATANNIEKFKITDEELRFQIALKWARKNGRAIAQSIEKFHITKEEHRFQIALECLEQDGMATMQSVGGFHITQEELCFKFALESVKQNRGLFCYYIESFHITEEEHRFQIAIECAKCDAGKMLWNIESFQITREEYRFQIALECARHDGEGVARNIGKFEITNEVFLSKIAMECARQNVAAIAENIAKFNIANEELRFQIAIECAKYGGGVVVWCISNFNLANKEQYFQIALECARHDGRGTERALYNFKKNEFFSDHAIDTIKHYCIANMLEKHEPLSEVLERYLQELPSEVRQKFQESESIKISPEFQAFIRDCNHPYRWVQLFLTSQKLSGVTINDTLSQLLIKAYSYRNYGLSMRYLEHIIELFHEKGFDNYPEKTSKSVSLLIVLLKKWQMKITKDPDSVVTEKRIMASLGMIQNSFKDAQTHLLQAMMHLMDKLDKDVHITTENKIKLIDKILTPSATVIKSCKDGFLKHEQEKQLLIRISCVDILCDFHEYEILQKLLLVSDDCIHSLDEFLSKSLQDMLIKDEFLKLPEIKDLLLKYCNTLGNMRIPHAWKIYETALKQTNNPELRNLYRTFIVDVLEGRYPASRYETSSLHRDRIQQQHAGIWQQWSQPVPVQTVQLNARIPLVFSFTDFLQKKQKDGHLGNLDFLKEFLASGKMNHNSEDVESSFVVQKKLAELAQMSSDEFMTHLHELQDIASQLPSGVELRNDLQGLQQTLEKQRSETREVHLIDTDDYQDLLLCGTEVAGSCQRIDGDPSLNKCLIAYLVDGKNRMLAIKDPTTGKILARCFFRLLLEDRTGKPVLFIDRIYPIPSPPAFEELLFGLAKQRAQQLGLCLYKKDEGGETACIRSLGSPAPFEYEDAVPGIMPNGIFEVSATKVEY